MFARLDPAPELVAFPGDEVVGLTDDTVALRAVAALVRGGEGVARPQPHSLLAYDRQSYGL